MEELNILHLDSFSILEQLKLEEALLRADNQNWCIINRSSTLKAIVMGLSGKKELLLHEEKVEKERIPVIKRFSGGGTVVVDHNTLFVTFIFQKDVHSFDPFPENIMKWSAKICNFDLRENDFVIGEHKFGGNAQYILKDRWLHHTSLLWDYDASSMEYLKNPAKQPKYRQKRSHADFLVKMKAYYPSKDAWIDSLINTLSNRYTVREVNLEEAEKIALKPHRKATTVLTQEEKERAYLV